MTAPLLLDPHGRRIRKLRVSLTDACNHRCFYCMPANPDFMPRTALLEPSSLIKICGHLARLGITHLRITGGEPFMRKEFDEIADGLSALPVAKIGLTTNGLLLSEKLGFLQKIGLLNLNVSLDSLDADRFRLITRTGKLAAVLDAIYTARDMGFTVKVNVVVARGVNDAEIPAFARWSAVNRIPVRFLELMKIGPAIADHERQYLPAAEMLDRLRSEHELVPVLQERDSTAFVYRTPEGAELGFIASESKPFCGGCSRLRLSATGKLRSCLMREDGIDLASRDSREYPTLLMQVMAGKPTGRIEQINEAMNRIGG